MKKNAKPAKTAQTKSAAAAATAAASSSAPREMNGADCVVECLLRENVEVIFAYPGGAAIELHQSFARNKNLRVVLPRHEQGGAYAAGGYARASGRVGVCTATSGPGATNLISGIADAFMDSVPLVAITGQVASKYIGKSAFQETDFFGMTLPIVKHSYLVLNVHDLPRVFKEAFELARSGRPGPVIIDIPKDVQQARFTPQFPESVSFRNKTIGEKHTATDEQLAKILALVSASKKPVIYAGGGIISANAHDELRAFAERARIPVATTLMGLGAFPESNPLSLRWFGMHGSVAGNWAVDQCDLLLSLGVRFDDRITGDTGAFASRAKIVHLDIDASEHNKNKRVDLPVRGDVKDALARMNKIMAANAAANAGAFVAPDTSAWVAQTRAWSEAHPFAFPKSAHILPGEAIAMLHELTKGDAIIATGVGQHQMWAAQFYPFEKPRRYISSLGLGAMGYGLPAAIGAKAACPDRQVIDIDGDGSTLMNIQELATAKIEKINIKVMVLNNQHLGMVTQWEDRFYKSVRGQTILGDINNIGSPTNIGGLYPDFTKIAEGFGVAGRRVIKKSELRAAIQEMLDCKGPYLLDVVVPHTEHVLPMIPAGKTVKDMIMK